MSEEHTVHPAAEVFPMLKNEQLVELAADIRANGLVHPIETCRGQIIDGRNRKAACDLLGMKPTFRDLTDTLPNDEAVVRHVIAANIHRRHLTTAQRSAIAAELATLTRGGDRKSKRIKPPNGGLVAPSSAAPITNAAAATLMNVSPRSVERAKATMKASPAAHEAAKRGDPKPTKQKNASAASTARATSTKPPAPPPKSAVSTTFVPPPPKAKPASAPAATRRETAPVWYDTLCRDVLALAHAAMEANRVPAAEIVGALDDVILKLEDEGA